MNEFIDQAWAAAQPTLMEYIPIPARSPMFDTDWDCLLYTSPSPRD